MSVVQQYWAGCGRAASLVGVRKSGCCWERRGTSGGRSAAVAPCAIQPQSGDWIPAYISAGRAKALVRTRVEPKTFFANERTFLQWLQIR